MNDYFSYRRAPLGRRGAALGAFAACAGLLALPACTIELDDWPSTAAITPIEGAIGITRIPLSNAPDAGDLGDGSDVDVLLTPDGGEPALPTAR